MSKYKYGKQKKMQDKEAFAEIMEKGHFAKPIHKVFLVLLYYTGARVSEIISLTHGDFILGPTLLSVDIKASKHGVERPAFILPLTLPYVLLVAAILKDKKRLEKLFPFSRQTAWNIIKRVMPKHYPHFFRLSRCVSFLDRGIPPNKIRIWFGWKSLKTIDSYLGYSQKTTEELSEGLE